MSEHLLLSRDGKRCWKAVVKGRKYTIYSGPTSSPVLRGSNTVRTAAEALERVRGLEAHMRTKGYGDAGASPEDASADMEPLPRSVSRIRLAAVKRHTDELRRSFKPSKESSLVTMASLAVVLLAHRRVDELKDLADFTNRLGPAVKPSHAHYVQDALAVASQACLESGDATARQRLRRTLKKLSANPHVLTRDWIEHHHDFGLHGRRAMTLVQETTWRITMVRALAKVVELGGSPTLRKAHAQEELDEHLAHLRAVWKIHQDDAPKRPRGRRAPYPIRSHLFPSDAAG